MPAPTRRPTRRRASRLVLAVLAATAALCGPVGCAGTQRTRRGGIEGRAPAGAVTGENFTDVLRELDESPHTDALRPLRDATARYQATRGIDRLNDGDTEGAIRSLRAALVHYTPEELGRGGLPGELAPLARGILDMVSPRGDEASALAANRVLAAIAPPDPNASRRFQDIVAWGEGNRREFRTPWVYRGEMAEIYKEVARIIPAPDVLQRATEFQLGRRRAAMDAIRSGGRGMTQQPTFEDQQQLRAGLQNTPLDLAIIYLRLGDLAGAAEQVEQLSEGQSEQGLGAALRAIANGEGGADGLWALASRLDRVDPGAFAGVCRRGRREHPNDARFALCLAVAARREGEPGLASAHMEAAAALSPNDSRALREAIGASVQWLADELGTDDPTPGRRAYARTRALIEQWGRRFPRDPLPLTVGEVEDIAAQLELGHANLAGAQQHLERGTQATPPARDAYRTLAEIAWRHGEARRALQLLEQGMALPTRPTESDSTFRPSFQLRMGLAARAAGDEALATRHLSAAQGAFEALARSLDNTEQRAEAQWQNAVALDALGRRDEARRSIDAALNADPDSRDLAARAITFSMARGRFADALEFDRAARGRLQLDRPWQVYFGLWGVISARMTNAENDGGARDALEDIAETAGPHSPWTVRIAQRYVGRLDRDGLMRHAGDHVGHRAEALFYEAMLALAAGDVAAAERDLRAVVATDMLRYFEYDMAWEMVQRGVASVRAAAAQQAASGSSASQPASSQVAQAGATSNPANAAAGGGGATTPRGGANAPRGPRGGGNAPRPRPQAAPRR